MPRSIDPPVPQGNPQDFNHGDPPPNTPPPPGLRRGDDPGENRINHAIFYASEALVDLHDDKKAGRRPPEVDPGPYAATLISLFLGNDTPQDNVDAEPGQNQLSQLVGMAVAVAATKIYNGKLDWCIPNRERPPWTNRY